MVRAASGTLFAGNPVAFNTMRGVTGRSPLSNPYERTGSKVRSGSNDDASCAENYAGRVGISRTPVEIRRTHFAVGGRSV